MKAIDLFCGCGGISSGLSAAGFEILAGCDVEPSYAVSFSKNFPKAQTILDDLSVMQPREFAKRLGVRPGELALVAGGPPCQGFSKNVPKKQRSADSANNQLVTTFLDYCEYLRPRAIMMENVAEMKNGFDATYSAMVATRLENAGYKVRHAVLNSAEFGVPQRRRRAFFVATKGCTPELPVRSHFSPEDDEMNLLPHYVSVWEAIGDLPSLKHGTGISPCEYASEPFSVYQEWARGSASDVRNHVARFLQPTQFQRLSSLKPGQGLKDLPPELRTRGGYSGAYGRLTKTMVAPTITRWLFHPGSGRYGHPVDVRTITIREAARLQGFPDRFEFEGTFLQQAGQIGNAVPPLLAFRVAQALLRVHTTSSAPAFASKAAKLSWDMRYSAVGS